MPHSQTLRDAYASFKSGDLAGVFAALDEQIEWRVPSALPQGGDYRGHAGVMDYFGRLAQALDAPEVDVEAVLEDGDRVVVLGRVTARNAAYPFVHSWQFAGARAIRFAEYVDAPAAIPLPA